ncbi:MAG: hypothetical protein A2901_09425 [Elusimicrobia bacterium RIFCSPLOWO2_01_FULL_54_10]|nr:MAG: hypothetical protein A2901_09425 [Elusimicrobia bacterium RIFCSPLOWO2_01_FULL_54_10]
MFHHRGGHFGALHERLAHLGACFTAGHQEDFGDLKIFPGFIGKLFHAEAVALLHAVLLATGLNYSVHFMFLY